MGSKIKEFPFIRGMQRIVLYGTYSRYYIVGSNNCETRFRVLKIERDEERNLHIIDDKEEYSQSQLRMLLLTIDSGNRSKKQANTKQGNNGLTRIESAFGIVGFVRFLEGYYIILITKRRRVALIGAHTIYKVEDTSMIYIPNSSSRRCHPDESRYVKMFQNVDLSSNFYFSYSYDLTHTLQYNLSPSKGLDATNHNDKDVHSWPRTNSSASTIGLRSSASEMEVEDACKVVPDIRDNVLKGSDSVDFTTSSEDERGEMVYAVRDKPTYKFAWNEYLLKPFEDQLHTDWLLYITHGFIGQSNISVYGRPIFLTLIARRSNQFAGTRFLKRGANSKGYVANEVETEQIVHDASVLSLSTGFYTSHVQVRGSVPLFWSQETSKMAPVVPKPQILLDQGDPYAFISGLHFNQILRRYGAPIIILNLVKKRERKRHESILHDEFRESLKYLNQFLPEEHGILHIGFDMHKVSKSKTSNVLEGLAEIADLCIKKTGFFHSGRELHCNQIRPNDKYLKMMKNAHYTGLRQTGVVRTNCVDCLDRTNTAQFAIGKCALELQLYALGVIGKPQLNFDTDSVRMLEDLYEDHGDTLALQYGGSQLVHRIQGYRKTAPWTSHSRDIMMTLSRYYSNAFSDAEKQQAINLFLGVYQPSTHLMKLWDLSTDYYLHVDAKPILNRKGRYSQWWDLPIARCLPYSYEIECKGNKDEKQTVERHPRYDERVDIFWDYYKPFELTCFDELYVHNMPNSVRSFMPKGHMNVSPFADRLQWRRKSGETGDLMNPNVSGKSTASTAQPKEAESSSSSDSDTDIEYDFCRTESSESEAEQTKTEPFTMDDVFPTTKEVYGVDIQPLKKNSTVYYKSFAKIGWNAGYSAQADLDKNKVRKGTNLIQKSVFTLDSSVSVDPPTISRLSRDVYHQYIKIGKKGALQPNTDIYRKYVASMYQ